MKFVVYVELQNRFRCVSLNLRSYTKCVSTPLNECSLPCIQVLCPNHCHTKPYFEDFLSLRNPIVVSIYNNKLDFTAYTQFCCIIQQSTVNCIIMRNFTCSESIFNRIQFLKGMTLVSGVLQKLSIYNCTHLVCNKIIHSTPSIAPTICWIQVEDGIVLDSVEDLKT